MEPSTSRRSFHQRSLTSMDTSMEASTNFRGSKFTSIEASMNLHGSESTFIETFTEVGGSFHRSGSKSEIMWWTGDYESYLKRYSLGQFHMINRRCAQISFHCLICLSVCLSFVYCLSAVYAADCESCTDPVSTNPGIQKRARLDLRAGLKSSGAVLSWLRLP